MLCKSGCHRLASRCMIIHSVHNNNPRSLSCTADLSPISIPTGTFSTTLHALFGKELDCASVVTATHTHRHTHTHTHHLLQNGLRLHLIICTWDVYLHSMVSHSFLSTGVWLCSKKKRTHFYISQAWRDTLHSLISMSYFVMSIPSYQYEVFATMVSLLPCMIEATWYCY